jgi:phosphatidylglycerophosphate synthase
VRSVHSGPVVGLTAQLTLLVGLAATFGLGATGWVVAVACGALTTTVLVRGLARSGVGALGPANRVTLARAVLVVGVAALTADSFSHAVPVAVLVLLSVVALVLDGVDGWVARRTRTMSELGARFDMEVDALLILVLSVYVARSVGPWVLAIGAARYAFLAAGLLLPWLRAPLPRRQWRKVVAATQGVVLTSAAAEVLPGPLTVALLVVSLGLLAESFGHDVAWLARNRTIAPPPVVSRRRATVEVGDL